MKALVRVIAFAVLFASTASAQSPKAATKSLLPARQLAPPGCKLVGAVKGTKLWAGDCTDAAAVRGAETAPSLPEQAGSAIPPGQKE